MSCATPILPSGPLGHVSEMTGHVAEIAGHHPETAGHVRPKYAAGNGLVRPSKPASQGQQFGALADIRSGWVLRQQCGRLLTVARSSSRKAASSSGELILLDPSRSWDYCSSGNGFGLRRAISLIINAPRNRAPS
ncbi:hypothetical protein C2L65_40560 [Paraburkholderia terrae]|uniref:Uncharacterized protein n=1 Tax=Paraburkholderia terrae TaxID=311230 RepID=A0A2I8F259_9BURK|nr:hypothetical protein C2L65_40560 [Paraburkholderia terrae]